MVLKRFLSDASRWDWYGSGDKTVAPPMRCSSPDGNSPDDVFWEIGLIVAVPLLVGVVATLCFAG